MPMSEHNLVELLSQLEAATLAEETLPVPLAPSAVAVVLVGTVAPAADGLPLWQPLAGDAWVLA